jgi:polysaccharide export outer membrane protein
MVATLLPRASASLAVALLLLAGCSSGPRPVATMAVPAPPELSRGADNVPAPAFQKVPPEENPALLQEAGAGGPMDAALYRLDVSDVLDISIYDEADLQHIAVPVRPDGRISFAFVGDVMAAGRSVEEIRAELTTSLSKYLRSPQVMVILKEFAQKKVFIGGEVKSPGIVYLSGKEGTLMDALYKAGLTTEKASLDGAYIMRRSKLVAADFKQLVRGDLTRNVRLMDEDVIYVPENVNRFVYVLGEVRQNNSFAVNDPVPIIDLIARAGGFNDFAKKKEIAVVRGGLKAPEVAIINADALISGDFRQNILIKPGDIVYVSKTGLGKFLDVLDIILKTISPVIQGTIISNSVNP